MNWRSPGKGESIMEAKAEPTRDSDFLIAAIKHAGENNNNTKQPRGERVHLDLRFQWMLCIVAGKAVGKEGRSRRLGGHRKQKVNRK